MDTDFIAIAEMLRDLARKEFDENRLAEGLSLLESAFTSAFMAKSTTPLSFKLRPHDLLPRPLASAEHVIVRISRGGIVIFAALEIAMTALCVFQRFPMVGEFFSNISKKIPDTGTFECIVDLGDGDDSGDYQRVSYCSSRADSILVPDPLFYICDNYNTYRANVAQYAKPWGERKNVIFWRGGSGGPRLKKPDPKEPLCWDWQQRLQLCAASRRSRYADILDVGLIHQNAIGEAYLREAIEHAGFMRPEVPKEHFLDYRYLIDVDGWTNAWSLLDKMIGGATIMKVCSALGFRQWYYDKLVPWKNYIPLAADLSDLDEVIEWMLSNPEECEKIGAGAASLAEGIQLLPDLAKAESAVLAILSPL